GREPAGHHAHARQCQHGRGGDRDCLAQRRRRHRDGGRGRMTSRRFAGALGLILVLAGIAGFVPALVTPADSVHGLSLDAGRPLLLGWFGASALNNVVRIAIGLAGLVSARRLAEAVRWCRRAAGLFLLLAVCGVVPGLDTMFGL